MATSELVISKLVLDEFISFRQCVQEYKDNEALKECNLITTEHWKSRKSDCFKQKNYEEERISKLIKKTTVEE